MTARSVDDLKARMLKAVTTADMYAIAEDAIDLAYTLEAKVAFREVRIRSLEEKNARQVKMLEAFD